MKSAARRLVSLGCLGLAGLVAPLCPCPLGAQAPLLFPTPTTPEAQRNALNRVRSQVHWLQNATRAAPNYRVGGAEKVWQEFLTLRETYRVFIQSLSPPQLNAGANDLAELEAGLDILQEAFGNYEGDLAAGRSSAAALRSLCQVLARGSSVWEHELNKCCVRLRVGGP